MHSLAAILLLLSTSTARAQEADPKPSGDPCEKSLSKAIVLLDQFEADGSTGKIEDCYSLRGATNPKNVHTKDIKASIIKIHDQYLVTKAIRDTIPTDTMAVQEAAKNNPGNICGASDEVKARLAKVDGKSRDVMNSMRKTLDDIVEQQKLFDDNYGDKAPSIIRSAAKYCKNTAKNVHLVSGVLDYAHTTCITAAWNMTSTAEVIEKINRDLKRGCKPTGSCTMKKAYWKPQNGEGQSAYEIDYTDPSGKTSVFEQAGEETAQFEMALESLALCRKKYSAD
jgi:hypothetical protein